MKKENVASGAVRPSHILWLSAGLFCKLLFTIPYSSLMSYYNGVRSGSGTVITVCAFLTAAVLSALVAVLVLKIYDLGGHGVWLLSALLFVDPLFMTAIPGLTYPLTACIAALWILAHLYLPEKPALYAFDFLCPMLLALLCPVSLFTLVTLGLLFLFVFEDGAHKWVGVAASIPAMVCAFVSGSLSRPDRFDEGSFLWLVFCANRSRYQIVPSLNLNPSLLTAAAVILPGVALTVYVLLPVKKKVYKRVKVKKEDKTKTEEIREETVTLKPQPTLIAALLVPFAACLIACFLTSTRLPYSTLIMAPMLTVFGFYTRKEPFVREKTDAASAFFRARLWLTIPILVVEMGLTAFFVSGNDLYQMITRYFV
ncbi:MAG: hypothetical protein IJK02_04450 [Clostridia bacterium]|nr:hypothetical protein [Clostridia bacterium]